MVGRFIGKLTVWAVVWLFAYLCWLACIAAIGVQEQNEIRRVPNSTVSNIWCQYDGGTQFVTEHPTEPGVYAVHCQDGQIMTGGTK